MKLRGASIVVVGAFVAALCSGRLTLVVAEECNARSEDDAKNRHFELPPPIVECNGRSLEATLIEHLGLHAETRLQRAISRPTNRDTITTRFDVFVFELPVMGALITVEHDEAETLVFSIYQYPDRFPTSPEQSMLMSNVLSSDDAINTIARTFVSTYSSTVNTGRHRQSKLGWYSMDKEGRDIRLAYKAAVLLDPPVAEKNIKPEGLIDARTGEILRSWDGVYHYGQTTIPAIGGNNCSRWNTVTYPSIRVSKNGDMCTLQTPDFWVHHSYNEYEYSNTPWSFPCASATTAFDQMFGANGPCFDVAYALNHSIEMYVELTGEYPLDPSVSPTGLIEASCHFGLYYHDAHFDGHRLYIGDASPRFFCPFTSLDMVAHELAHAWNTLHAELANEGQDGAIGEATADLAGFMAVQYVTGNPTLMWATQVTRGGHPLRDFCSPRLSWLYRQIEHVSQYNDNLSVHVAGGAYSKAYCLVLSKCGWDVPSLFKVVFRAAALYWFMSIDFNGAFCALLRSVREIYPGDAQRIDDFVTSFAVIGVSC